MKIIDNLINVNPTVNGPDKNPAVQRIIQRFAVRSLREHPQTEFWSRVFYVSKNGTCKYFPDYLISNRGNVVKAVGKSFRSLAVHETASGKCFTVNGIRFLVDRAIASTFIPLPEEAAENGFKNLFTIKVERYENPFRLKWSTKARKELTLKAKVKYKATIAIPVNKGFSFTMTTDELHQNGFNPHVILSAIEHDRHSYGCKWEKVDVEEYLRYGHVAPEEFQKLVDNDDQMLSLNAVHLRGWCLGRDGKRHEVTLTGLNEFTKAGITHTNALRASLNDGYAGGLYWTRITKEEALKLPRTISEEMRRAIDYSKSQSSVKQGYAAGRSHGKTKAIVITMTLDNKWKGQSFGVPDEAEAERINLSRHKAMRIVAGTAKYDTVLGFSVREVTQSECAEYPKVPDDLTKVMNFDSVQLDHRAKACMAVINGYACVFVGDRELTAAGFVPSNIRSAARRNGFSKGVRWVHVPMKDITKYHRGLPQVKR